MTFLKYFAAREELARSDTSVKERILSLSQDGGNIEEGDENDDDVDDIIEDDAIKEGNDELDSQLDDVSEEATKTSMSLARMYFMH
jgi:hypothetical protein